MSNWGWRHLQRCVCLCPRILATAVVKTTPASQPACLHVCLHASSPATPRLRILPCCPAPALLLQALLGLPKILAENSGYDPQDTIIALQVGFYNRSWGREGRGGGKCWVG